MLNVWFLLIIIISPQNNQQKDNSISDKDYRTGLVKTDYLNNYLFNEGIDYFESNKFLKAISNFNKIFSNQNIINQEKAILLYNIALSYEKLKDYENALIYYEKVLSIKDVNFIYKDTFYRISATCYFLKKQTCVIKNLARWKRSDIRLNLAENFEFMVRTGVAYFNLSSLYESIKYLKSAVNVYKNKYNFLIKNAKSINLSEEKINSLALWSFETLGQSYINSGNKINLSFPKTNDQKLISQRLENALDLKAFYYLKAQDIYLEMIKLGDTYVASKGMYEIAKMYKDVYFDLLNSEIPPNLKKYDLVKEYLSELKITLKPLINKALTAAKKNIEYSKTYKYENNWIVKTKTILEELNKK